ncbi:3-hydroxybutyryl-CoA dehydrogenase [Chitinophaga pendula]|uniref:3-hydroxyacyl-CoA dehydrogenase NAD-binding domain-containing protein n=1 Tax=Chitinophaga TaxID=79328 RepID=UPI000BAF6596|nr:MULTISPECIES: 3-hydroxyacyl-CoA dehydrogenase NAD-binding domain-containing protein [Chitinophaga]ASZ10303.1 3-hydroxybutyryl-CoA dehydrogenase [Chitinophaga sp. MD30]UCJ06735.1 3-hydroxybutyryl-CoA dehydrogenase [Chitinophaga pendula]
MIALTQIHQIAVCGAGTMGAGIAQVAATSGYSTTLYDLQPAVLEKAKDQIRQQLDTAVSKGKLGAADSTAIFDRIHFTGQLSDCKADVIIEAIVERTDIKISLFNALAEINTPATIFASNTSSLSISHIAAEVSHPQRVIGMHFFNPAHLMKLVEVISAEQTAPAVEQAIYDLAVKMGKTPVRVKDSPGFIVNRVARHYYLEAMKVAEQGIAGFREIDQLLESAGFRMGPFALMDLIGNDVNLAVSTSLYESFRKAVRFAPNKLQIERVASGQLGRKSNKGFYDYTKG